VKDETKWVLFESYYEPAIRLRVLLGEDAGWVRLEAMAEFARVTREVEEMED
jgi:hypothetical protein